MKEFVLIKVKFYDLKMPKESEIVIESVCPTLLDCTCVWMG